MSASLKYFKILNTLAKTLYILKRDCFIISRAEFQFKQQTEAEHSSAATRSSSVTQGRFVWPQIPLASMKDSPRTSF